jgi:hypothetical protein
MSGISAASVLPLAVAETSMQFFPAGSASAAKA